MDLRHLRYFEALWKEGSFTRAAVRAHVAQSTLSHQIRQLEDSVGHPLFRRTDSGVTPTAAGELFHEHAVRTLASFDEGIAAMKSIRLEQTGRLRVGVTPTLNVEVVPKAVAALLARHPRAQVVLSELDSDTVARQVAVGLLDMGIAYAPAPSSGLVFQPLFDDELVLMVAPDHPLANRRRLRVAELHGIDMALQPASCTTRQLLNEALKAAGAQPYVVTELSSLPALKALVRRSGVAAVASPLMIADSDGLVQIPIEGPTVLRVPGFVSREQPPDYLAAAFRESVREAVDVTIGTTREGATAA